VSASPHPPFDQVRSDDTGGSIDAVRYLIRLGHKRICFIGDISHRWYADRYQAYLTVMTEAGLEPIAQTVALSPDNFSNGFSSAEAIFRRRVPITAIFAAGDDVAFGAWEHLRQIGLHVPDDISLIGFGDLPGSNLKNPPMTTVRQPCIEIGRQLAKLAIEKAKMPATPIPEVIVPTELILRGTTWPLVEQSQTKKVLAGSR
jgi:DNA-binding LacI/PurR family transcriptional regulator